MWAAIIVALVAFGAYEHHHLIAEGEAHELAALKVSSDKLLAANAIEIQKTAATYATTVASITEVHENEVNAAAVAHADALRSLSDFDAYRRSHTALDSAASPSAAVASGTASTFDVETVFASLEPVALGLADATHAVNAALTMCMAERAELTGK
jgi:hypothetical protein